MIPEINPPDGAEHKPIEMSVGVSPDLDRVVIIVDNTNVALCLQDAIRFQSMMADACQQLIDALKRPKRRPQ